VRRHETRREKSTKKKKRQIKTKLVWPLADVAATATTSAMSVNKLSYKCKQVATWGQ